MSWLLWIGLAIVAGIGLLAMLPKPRPLNAAQVALHIHHFLEGGGNAWDWDDFEHARVERGLERIQHDAIMAGGCAEPDVARLRELMHEAQALAQGKAAAGAEAS